MNENFERIMSTAVGAEDDFESSIEFANEFHALSTEDKYNFLTYVSEHGPNWNATIPTLMSLYFQSVDLAHFINEPIPENVVRH